MTTENFLHIYKEALATLSETHEQTSYWDKYKGKPFYCQDYATKYHEITEEEGEDFRKSECCTTHMMGLPVKDGKLHPLYEFQFQLMELEKKYQNLIDAKATGIGDSELKLRQKAHMAINDPSFFDGQGVIFTGPRLELAVTLIDRMKALFPDYQSKEKNTIFTINRTRFEAYPSYHTHTARGLPNVVYMLIDEFDFFPPGQQQEVMAVQQRYLAKGNPLTNSVSTPNLPLGLLEMEEKSEMNTIIRFQVDKDYQNLELIYEQEVEEPIYCFVKLPYEIGVDRIFTREDIKRAKLTPSFPREYELRYGYGIGDIFQGLDDIIEEYNVSPTLNGTGALCADPAFGSSDGSSKFGVCGGDRVDNIGYVREAREYPRPSPSAMLDVLENLAPSYNNNVQVDAAHAGFIRDLNARGVSSRPISFGKPIKNTETNKSQSLRSVMTINAAQMVKNKKVRIHPMFRDLIAQLRAAKFDEKGGVDKKELNFDIGDSFIMWCYEMEGGKGYARKLKTQF